MNKNEAKPDNPKPPPPKEGGGQHTTPRRQQPRGDELDMPPPAPGEEPWLVTDSGIKVYL